MRTKNKKEREVEGGQKKERKEGLDLQYCEGTV